MVQNPPEGFPRITPYLMGHPGPDYQNPKATIGPSVNMSATSPPRT